MFFNLEKKTMQNFVILFEPIILAYLTRANKKISQVRKKYYQNNFTIKKIFQILFLFGQVLKSGTNQNRDKFILPFKATFLLASRQ